MGRAGIIGTRVNSFVGIPWARGGHDLDPNGAGADCWGLTRAVLELAGLQVSDPWETFRDLILEEIRAGGDTSVFCPDELEGVRLDDLKRLDVIYFGRRTGNHYGLVGEDRYVLTTCKGRGSHLVELRRALRTARSGWRVRV